MQYKCDDSENFPLVSATRFLPTCTISVEIFANHFITATVYHFTSVYISIYLLPWKSAREVQTAERKSESAKSVKPLAVQSICMMVLYKKTIFDLTYGLAFYSKVVHTSFLYLKAHEP